MSQNSPNERQSAPTEAQKSVWTTETAAEIKRSIVDGLKERCPWANLITSEWLPEGRGCKLSSNIYSSEKKGEIETPEKVAVGVVWTRKTLDYAMYHSRIKSPSNQTDVSKLKSILRASAVWAYDRRQQTEFERMSERLIVCGTNDEIDNVKLPFGTPVEGYPTPKNVGYLTDAPLDYINNRLQIVSHEDESYGIKDDKPLFALVIGCNACASVRGDYFIKHPIPLPPRFNDVGGRLVRVEPHLADGTYNRGYCDAPFEVAYALNRSVMTNQFPRPQDSEDDPSLEGAVDVEWIAHDPEDKFFMVTLSSAIKPMLIENGYIILFRRPATS